MPMRRESAGGTDVWWVALDGGPQHTEVRTSQDDDDVSPTAGDDARLLFVKYECWRLKNPHHHTQIVCVTKRSE